MTPSAIFRLVWKALEGMNAKNGVEIAGYIAFTTMLALFPFLIFLVSVAGFLGNTTIGQQFLLTMALFMPPDVMNTLQPALQQVSENRSGGLLTIGLVLALYSAASGVDALRTALDLSYGVTESRSFWFRKTQNFVIVIVGSVIVIVSSTAIILGPFLWKVVIWFIPFDPNDQRLWHLARYAFALFMMVGGVMALHRVLPNAHLKWRQILPGALVTTITWLIAQSGLTYYLGTFANYGSMYGSLGGVIITLLFFYISGIIFIFGGELNALLMARRHPAAASYIEEFRSSASPSPVKKSLAKPL